MAVPEQIPVVNYVADGIVKKFDVPFEYDQQSDLHVYVDGAEPTIDKYYFDGNAFNFYIAPTSGQDVKIKRITPKERDTDYNLHTNTVRPKALNTDFDRIWYVLQEVFSDVGGLSQAVQDEIIARIQGDEDLLNQLTAEISARMLGDEAVTEDLKNYVNQVVGAIINDPDFDGIDANKVNDASGETQQQVNYNGGSKWHSRVGGYKLNERVILTNGDIVKSTIPNNTNDPNVDMTGWVKPQASDVFDASGLSQQSVNNLNIESSAFNKIHSGVLSEITDVTKFGDYYYFYTGTLPHTVTELTPTSQYKCVGMLNGYPLNHVKNWGIVEDGTDQATKFQFALENATVDNLVSDGEVISISKVDITTSKAIKILGFSNLRFKPYFTAPEVTKDYLFKVNHSETEWENITVDNPESGKFVTRIFNITESIRHKFTRIMISCPDYRIGTVFDMGLVKESGFTDLRIDLDVATKQGTIFKSQSCVNNWVTGGMYGFGENFLYCSPTTTIGYKSEGWMLSNLITVYFKNPLNCPAVTAFQATNCVFDFCIEKFFEFTNGSHSMISNCWFASEVSSSASQAPAIVSTSAFDGITLYGNTFINNNDDNKTPLFSFNPNPNSNSFITMNRVQGFTKGIILNCESAQNVYIDYDQSVQSIVNAENSVEGLRTEFINKNSWLANTEYYALVFDGKSAKASIRALSGNFSDLTRLNFYTSVGGVEQLALSLHNGDVVAPSLPSTLSEVEIGGLYAGADNVVKIRRS